MLAKAKGGGENITFAFAAAGVYAPAALPDGLETRGAILCFWLQGIKPRRQKATQRQKKQKLSGYPLLLATAGRPYKATPQKAKGAKVVTLACYPLCICEMKKQMRR